MNPPSIEAIRKRAAKFALEFSDAHYEAGQAQSFIRGLCEVFDLPYLKAVSFEHRVKKLGGARGRIDGFFPGLLLIEMKSAGEDLDAAFLQATKYLPMLDEAELPRHILVSDFRNIHLYDRISHGTPLRFTLGEFPRHVEALLFLAGYKTVLAEKQAAINTHAAETLARLHDVMQANGYRGKDLERYLVRLVFCLFADDTGLFGRNDLFHSYLLNQTRGDGTDLHQRLDALFEVLDSRPEHRPPTLPAVLREFPYVNGALFQGRLATYYFDEASRNLLLDCVGLDWSEISPEIFGALFQAIMHFDDEVAVSRSRKRREFGAHYTSELNIKKAIEPLFIDDLRRELNGLLSMVKGRSRNEKLRSFQHRLSQIQILDPACGCGNFLVVAYRELRLLEIDAVATVYQGASLHLDVESVVQCSVSQCHGIEIDEGATQIAMVALWLTDHQLNMRLGEKLGTHYARLPLLQHANIVRGNALAIDWETVLPASSCRIIVGNPPFVGAMLMSESQRQDMASVFTDLSGYGVLDYVSAWYWKAVRYIQSNPAILAAFVSTNSIVQGEQTAILWAPLITRFGVSINFAHQTFRWSNEGRGVAAVHCVVVGFALTPCTPKRIFAYGHPTAVPEETDVTHINPYLVDAPDVFLENRSRPLCPVPPMAFGNMPRDGGALLLTDAEKAELLREEPEAAQFVRPFNSAKEFLNNQKRWCLWLKDVPPEAYRPLHLVRARIDQVRRFREASKAASTRKFAATPAIFCQISQPTTDYLLVPRHSSENRRYIPLGFCPATQIVADSCLFVPNAGPYHFGVMSSAMHMAWVRFTCGRIKSDFRYSKDITYNNFPWPDLEHEEEGMVSAAAQAVLDARAQFPTSSLADLYDPLTMPAALVRAHDRLDAAVDRCYAKSGGQKKYGSDGERAAFLLRRFHQLTGKLPLSVDGARSGRRKLVSTASAH
jgi:hypothetical protein